MQYAMTISVAVWTLLAAVVMGLALYRKLFSGGELDLIHVGDAQAAQISRQEFRSRRLDSIDHWGKLMTVATVAYGLVIAAIYLIRLWQASNQMIS
jgi:hypothetical protein